MKKETETEKRGRRKEKISFMELSPFKGNKSCVYRSRSTSFSTPTCRNFLYQEVFAFGENALVRSFSCGQVFRKGKTGETIESNQVEISKFTTPVRNLTTQNNKISSSIPRTLAMKKPAGANLSVRCSKKSNIEYKLGESKSTSKMLRGSLCLNILILGILCSCYFFMFRHCSLEWKTEETFTKLSQNVFGQDTALFKIKTLLNKFSYSNESMVISFIGGTGVGKTLVADIIYNNFPWMLNKYIHFFDSNTEKIVNSKKYSSCGCNLVIIDGMDVTSVRKVLNIVNTTDSVYMKFLMILIFQTSNQNEVKVVLESLNNSNIKIHSVVFNNLKKEDVRQCFDAELRRQGKSLSKTKLNEIVLENMKFCNISQGFVGCKNVFQEVSLFPDHN